MLQRGWKRLRSLTNVGGTVQEPPFLAETLTGSLMRYSWILILFPLSLCVGSCEELCSFIFAASSVSPFYRWNSLVLWALSYWMASGQSNLSKDSQLVRGKMVPSPALCLGRWWEDSHTGWQTCLLLLPTSHTLLKGTSVPASLFSLLRPEVKGPVFARDTEDIRCVGLGVMSSVWRSEFSKCREIKQRPFSG